MHKRYCLVLLFSAIVTTLLVAQPSYAASQDVVLSQIKTGNSSTSRLVEIYNNSDSDVNITGWCLYYSAASNSLSSRAQIGCFTDSNPAINIFLPARAFALLASSQTGIEADKLLMAGLGTGTSGHVSLMDSSGQEIDRVGWGTATANATNPETQQVEIGDSRVIERKSAPEENDVLIDTDNNASDFFQSFLREKYKYGALYEVIDICLNLVGLQESLPDAYILDEENRCISPPMDICLNIEGLQESIPADYVINDEGDCVENATKLFITEMLPNPNGSDIGYEFIEIYNPNKYAVNLAEYLLYVGPEYEKKYPFPADTIIEPGEYLAVYNSLIKYTLLNSQSRAKLVRISDDKIMYEVPMYENPASGVAWALIDDAWQYTSEPTTNAENVLSDNTELNDNLTPCAPHQYRHPETNRCRNIETGSDLVPCKEGQYRHPETNRCRNIETNSGLVPCKEGQYRHPETNRCRSIAGASTLKPCKEGQYRHPETNRCRNIVAMTSADYRVEEMVQSLGVPASWWLFGGTGTLAIGYGTWEWRQELGKVLHKLRFIPRLAK